jgi:aminopeptidase N
LFTNVSGQPDEFGVKRRELTLPTADPMFVGTNARGQYLVRYTTDAHQQAMVEHIRSKQFGEADRLMLLNGASMQARAGYQPYGNVLSMLDAYADETSEPVWGIIALVTGEARRFIDQDPGLEDRIKPFIDRLVATQVARLGWEAQDGESAADQKLRALVLSLAAYAENEAVVTKATQMFADYKDKQVALPAELRTLVWVIPVKNGNDAAFDFLINLHDTTQNSDLKGDACDALTATRDPKRAEQLLTRLKDPKVIKPQDLDRWLVYLLRNRYVRDTAWDWLVANWGWLETTFANDKSYDYLPRYAASCVNTRAYQQKFRDLFESKQDQLLLKRNIQLGFEEIETRLQWLERDLSSVRQFFTQ